MNGSVRIREEPGGPTGEEVMIGVNEYGKCPLCKRKWQNPAVLPSGWVVCWRCGWDAVEGDDSDEEGDEHVQNDGLSSERGGGQAVMGIAGRRGRCPITGVAVAPGELRRVLV
jgi:peroxin-12